MGGHHHVAHVLMAEQLLNRSDVPPTLKQVSDEGMVKRMAADGLGHSSLGHGPFHSLLHQARIQMT
jgi:hypothetical protein